MALTHHGDGDTPLDDPSGLKDRSIRTRSALDIVESDNILKAALKYLAGPVTPEEAPFDFFWMLDLHREMFGDVWDWAGGFRTERLNIGIEPRHVEEGLYNLSKNLPCWAGEPLLVQCARLHHEGVRIHPFRNGNGRWSRMMANVRANLKGGPIVDWPTNIAEPRDPARAEYIEALKQADKHRPAALEALHARYERKP